jgi:FAD/FMN-containing dehydrogenase
LRGSDLREALRNMRGAVRENVPLGPMMHLRIGGPADWFLEPFAEEDAALAVRVCRELGVPLRVLGGGSNVVVADAGVRGAVMHFHNLKRMVRDGNRLTVGAGVSLPNLLRSAKEASVSRGSRRLTGIPAQVGGAVAMNAGTRDGETFDHLVSLIARRAGRDALDVRGKDQLPRRSIATVGCGTPSCCKPPSSSCQTTPRRSSSASRRVAQAAQRDPAGLAAQRWLRVSQPTPATPRAGSSKPPAARR